jgi:eukaryotic-like serine/threonine-protein kinase
MSEQPHWKEPIAEGCYMIGRRNPDSILQCNTYLRSFERSGKSPIHWCIDSGSQIDFPQVRQHLLEHIGEIQALRMFSINHQDPDVVGNLPTLTRENHRLEGVTSEDVWRLVRHLDVRPRHLYYANKAKDNLIRLSSGQDIRVVPTPFCHFRGAMAFYDPDSQVLFSGDLFGGMNSPGRTQLYGEEADWPGIAQFHQIYMPSRAAVALAIRQIRVLRPTVKVIAPQHGFLLKGEFMHRVMDRLETLPVGIDLLPEELDEKYLEAYNTILHEVLREASAFAGRDAVMETLRRLPADHELRDCLKRSGDDVRLVRRGIRAIALVVDELARGQSLGYRALLQDRVLQGCTRLGAPLAQVGVGVEEWAESSSAGPGVGE